MFRKPRVYRQLGRDERHDRFIPPSREVRAGGADGRSGRADEQRNMTNRLHLVPAPTTTTEPLTTQYPSQIHIV
jgi:hypothetical protein